MAPRGLFLAREGRTWVAVDNTTGDAWTEDFSRKRQAVRWLRGKFEIGDKAKDWTDINTPDKLVTAAMRQGIEMNSAEAGVGLGYLEGHDYYLMMDADGNALRHDMQYKDSRRGDVLYTIQEAVRFCQEMNEDLLRGALSCTSSDAEYLSDLLQGERILDALATRMTQTGDTRK